MADRVVLAEIIDGSLGRETAAEEMAPHAVDVSFGEVVALDDKLSQIFATGTAFVSPLLAVQCCRLPLKVHAVPFLKKHLRICVYGDIVHQPQLRPRIHLLCHIWGAFSIELSKKGVDAPKTLLLPLRIEWVIVTLGALNLDAKKQPCCPGRNGNKIKIAFCTNTVLRIRHAQVLKNEIHRAVLVVFAAGRQQVENDCVPSLSLLFE